MLEVNNKDKTITIKLDEIQHQHLLIALGNVIRELNSIAYKVKELENGLTKIEGELKLIRIKMKE